MSTTSSVSSLLLEIGVEELPASFVDAALAALPALVTSRLDAARLGHGEAKAFGTPRRLSIMVPGVAAKQSDLDEELVGPPEAVAFRDGKPTKAAEAFAAKVGVAVEALVVVEKEAGGKQKAGRFLVGRKVEGGREATELLGKLLAEVCASIPFRKSMRWGTGEATFGRPVQWMVALFGSHPIDVSFAGVRSGRMTRGHRILSPAQFEVKSADGYVEALRAHHVLVDRDERAKTMMDRVSAAAKAAGGVHDPEPMLVDENASLVEEPFAVTGSFDKAYLSLPAVVIRAVARGHQKYFCVQKDEDTLLPHYITVVNTALNPKNVAKGNDRTMRARLADAHFFFEEDKKVRQEDRIEKLSGIVFQNQLGTVKDKVARIESLSTKIAALLGLSADDQALVKRAAQLCKSDLVALMVGEFPELQGHMGYWYAKHAGEKPQVAEAIRDHYRPTSATDDVAASDIAACVALADRIDSLTGCFGIGIEPTGAADPFALRRACIAALRTILDSAEKKPAYAKLDFGALVSLASDAFREAKVKNFRAETLVKVGEFATERLRGLIANATSAQVAEAVLSGAGPAALASPHQAMVRARALQAVVDGKEPWLAKAKLVARRLSGISKQAEPKLHPASTFAGSKKDDAAIVKLVEDADQQTRDLGEVAKVKAALAYTEVLATRLDDIFVNTLINDPEDPKTPQRLELLSFGAQCMLRLADFGKLS